MCRIEDCDRHELWGGYCLPHLQDHLNPKPKRRKAKKQIEAVEVMTTDDVEEKETREEA